jgi:hypothetical protein
MDDVDQTVHDYSAKEWLSAIRLGAMALAMFYNNTPAGFGSKTTANLCTWAGNPRRAPPEAEPY